MRSVAFTLACSAHVDAGSSGASPCSVQLNFPGGPPSEIAAVVRACDAALSAESRSRGAGTQFRTAHLRVYDYNKHEWVDLQHIAQLVPGGQIHADAAPSGGVPWSDRGPLGLPADRGGVSTPPPVPPPESPMDTLRPVSPHSQQRLSTERPFVSREEKLRVTFTDIAGDTAGPGFSCQQLDRRFRSVGIDFTVETVKELFDRADNDRNGLVTFAEWCEWGNVFPNTLECLYFRAWDKSEDSRLQNEAASVQEELKRQEVLTQPLRDELNALRARDAALRDELEQNVRRQDEVERHLRQADGGRVDQLRSTAASYERELRELVAKRDRLDGQERELMEQEVRLERQREALRHQQQRFAHARAAFDRGAHDMGSPRRAVPMQNTA
eukprot:TRINITY_DN47137_c0_g1_i1.p1 TRINITY_DN47137_c0_g1~~TRINITY_DN47137_c0_g1_i1.p1  ORF type:complete len:384 (+),score=91.05 TRINITY_DN47137_c0_g1_i1:75-1226(+)